MMITEEKQSSEVLHSRPNVPVKLTSTMSPCPSPSARVTAGYLVATINVFMPPGPSPHTYAAAAIARSLASTNMHLPAFVADLAPIRDLDYSARLRSVSIFPSYPRCPLVPPHPIRCCTSRSLTSRVFHRLSSVISIVYAHNYSQYFSFGEDSHLNLVEKVVNLEV